MSDALKLDITPAATEPKATSAPVAVKDEKEIKLNLPTPVAVVAAPAEVEDANAAALPTVAALTIETSAAFVMPTAKAVETRKYSLAYLLSQQHVRFSTVPENVAKAVAKVKAHKRGNASGSATPSSYGNRGGRGGMGSRAQTSTGFDMARGESILQEAFSKLKSGNGWTRGSVGASATEKFEKNCRSLLNKISPDNFPTVMAKIEALPVRDENKNLDSALLEIAVGIIMQKVKAEQTFVNLYAQVVKRLRQRWAITGKGKKSVLVFSKMVLGELKKELRITSKERIERALAASGGADKVSETIKKDITSKGKSACNSLAMFFGELFVAQIVQPAILTNLVSPKFLLKAESETDELPSIEGVNKAVHVIFHVAAGKAEGLVSCMNATEETLNTVSEKEKNAIKGLKKLRSFIIETIGILDLTVKKEKYDNRTRFAVLDLIDMSKENWVPRKKKGVKNSTQVAIAIDTQAAKDEQLRKDAHLARAGPSRVPRSQASIIAAKTDDDGWVTKTKKTRSKPKKNFGPPKAAVKKEKKKVTKKRGNTFASFGEEEEVEAPEEKEEKKAVKALGPMPTKEDIIKAFKKFTKNEASLEAYDTFLNLSPLTLLSTVIPFALENDKPEDFAAGAMKALAFSVASPEFAGLPSRQPDAYIPEAGVLFSLMSCATDVLQYDAPLGLEMLSHTFFNCVILGVFTIEEVHGSISGCYSPIIVEKMAASYVAASHVAAVAKDVETAEAATKEVVASLEVLQKAAEKTSAFFPADDEFRVGDHNIATTAGALVKTNLAFLAA